jgi:hypothetical protein
MTEAEIIRLVKQIVREELAPILMANVVSNESQLRSTIQRFSTDSEISNLRNIQPYGVSSRAPVGTSCLVIPVDGNPSHLNMVGHFDSAKPSTQDGEFILYDAYGHEVYLSQSKMQFGSKNSANPMMLGDIVQTLLGGVMDAIAQHQHLDQSGTSLTMPPNNAAAFEAFKASPIMDGGIISSKCFTEK